MEQKERELSLWKDTFAFFTAALYSVSLRVELTFLKANEELQLMQADQLG